MDARRWYRPIGGGLEEQRRHDVVVDVVIIITLWPSRRSTWPRRMTRYTEDFGDDGCGLD